MTSQRKLLEDLRTKMMEAGIELISATAADPLPVQEGSRHTQPRDLLPGALTVIAAGYCILYEPRIVASEPGRPCGRFTAYGSRIFEQMERHCAEVVSDFLRERGYAAAQGIFGMGPGPHRNRGRARNPPRRPRAGDGRVSLGFDVQKHFPQFSRHHIFNSGRVAAFIQMLLKLLFHKCPELLQGLEAIQIDLQNKIRKIVQAGNFALEERLVFLENVIRDFPFFGPVLMPRHQHIDVFNQVFELHV
jgi:hypothetical protein